MLLVKDPVPVPSVVLLFVRSGLAVVAQHTPLAVIVPPPSEVTFPPDTAVVDVMEVTAVVVTTAPVTGRVVTVCSLP
jgi:hypothetical protein